MNSFGDLFASAELPDATKARSEEHTSELQSQFHLVCRLLLEKKNDGRWPALGSRQRQGKVWQKPLVPAGREEARWRGSAGRLTGRRRAERWDFRDSHLHRFRR